jgi:acyl-CoA thioesterase
MTHAAKVIRDLLARDRFAGVLGIDLIEASPGSTVLAMTIQREHLNCYDMAHGGAIFTLADTAFGMAANTHDVVAIAIDAHVAFAVAVKEGDRLTASAHEVSRGMKTAVYRVDVQRQDGTTVSIFTGTVYVTGRPKPGTGREAL